MSQNEDRPRSFNGDSAIGGAVLALTSDHPFATIVLATFEIEPPGNEPVVARPDVSHAV